MRLLKPSWVSHDGNPIFSLDIHPDGTRLSTGGQGEDCGRIVIWNMAPIMNAEDERDENVPKMLCQMDNHLACVNCVRWSNNGKYLASGGDDKVIMIWQTGRYPSGSSVFGSGGKVNVEQWRCVNTLRGHSGDILDLAWSPHDAWLASCSVDNTLVVWNAVKFPEILSVLRGHSGLVKGVSWDPVGKYLASQSDDKSLVVWRTLDWQQEITVTEPFEECGGTTHVLRLSWSPDGQYLVSAHAMNNSGPTAQIIDRDGWKTEKDFVGHRKAITVAKFNPNIFSKPVKDGTKVQHYCCCAIGSRDRSLSVWLTALKRPLVVIHDLFSNSVMDISWSRKGNQLIVCSWDGTVAYVDFAVDEIGRPLSAEEHSSMHQRLYGKSLAMTNRQDSTNTIIENPDVLKLKGKLQDKEQVEQRRQQETQKTTIAAKGPINKQIETRTADGRRRITPMFIAPAPDLGDAPLPFSSKSQPTFSSSTESKSKIIIEKRDEVVCVNSNSNPPPSNRVTSSLISKPPIVQTVTISPPVVTLTTAVAATSSAAVTTENVSKVQVTPTVAPEPTKIVNAIEKPIEKVSEKPKEVKQVKIPDSSTQQLKRKIDFEDKPVKRRPGRPPLSEKSTPVITTPVATASPKTTPVVEKTTRENARTGHGNLHLPVLKGDKYLSVKIPTLKADCTMLLELDNNIQVAATVTVHKLKCNMGDGKNSWEVLLQSRGIGVVGSSQFIAVACEDNSLSIFSSIGQRLFPCFVLPSGVSKLHCSHHNVMVVTTKAHVFVWDVKNQKIIVKNESLYPIMSGCGSDLSIVTCDLTDNGSPVVSLSSGKSYMFSCNMACWMLLSNTDDIIQHYSDHQSFQPAQTIFNGAVTPLATLQAQGRKSSQQAFRLFRSLPAVQQTSTLSFLDSQLAAAFNLQSSKEYKFWLLTLMRYLTQEGIEVRIREICNSLLGPIPKSNKGSWELYILGLHKHDLLREILLIISQNLRLQRLFTEYQEQLELVKS